MFKISAVAIILLVSCLVQAQSRWEFPNQSSTTGALEGKASVRQVHCYANAPLTRTYKGREITSPSGAYRAEPLGGECDSTHLAVKALKGGRSYATSRGHGYDTGRRESWAPAVENISGFCWHPQEDVLFTSTMFWSEDTGVYRWDMKTGKIEKIALPRTKESHKDDAGVEHYEYLDGMSVSNISKDGRYIMMDYEPNVNLDDKKRRDYCYIIDTQDGSWTLYKKFKKRYPAIQFADAFTRKWNESRGVCP